MLFNAVVMNFPTSTFFKFLSIMQSVHCFFTNLLWINCSSGFRTLEINRGVEIKELNGTVKAVFNCVVAIRSVFHFISGRASRTVDISLAIIGGNAAEKEIIGSNFLPPTNFLWPLQLVLLF